MVLTERRRPSAASRPRPSAALLEAALAVGLHPGGPERAGTGWPIHPACRVAAAVAAAAASVIHPSSPSSRPAGRRRLLRVPAPASRSSPAPRAATSCLFTAAQDEDGVRRIYQGGTNRLGQATGSLLLGYNTCDYRMRCSRLVCLTFATSSLCKTSIGEVPWKIRDWGKHVFVVSLNSSGTGYFCH